MLPPRARRLALLLALVAFSACECDEGGFQQLVPLLSPDAARVTLPGVYVGATKAATMRYHSTGTGDVVITDVSLEDASAEGFRIEDAGATHLVPGAALEVLVSFTPSAEGPASVVVVVESNADNAPTRMELDTSGLAPLDCGASTTCERRTFDPDTGACVIEDLPGPCDDDNACTEDDVCFEGVCVGSALICPSPHDCTQGLCDASAGCVLLTHDERCEDDGNPCTAERCDAVDGCVREELPDGTLCGDVTMCASAALCYQGTCTVFDVPDGTPCSDGDFCTVADECHGGECNGTRVERPSEIAGELRLFGSENGKAVLLAGGRVLFLDPHTTLAVNGFVDAESPYSGVVATVVEVGESGLVVLAQTDLPAEPMPAAAVEASPGVVLSVVRVFDSELEAFPWSPRRLEVGVDGSVTVAAVGEPTNELGGVMAAMPDGRVVVRGAENVLTLLNPSDFTRERLGALPTEVEGAAVSVVGLEAFAGGVAVTDERGLHFVSAGGAVQAIGEDLGDTLGDGLDSDGGVLAALWRDDAPSPPIVQAVLYDAALEELARVTLDADAKRIALDDGILVVGRAGPAVAYDVSIPDDPVLLSGSLPWSTTSVDRLDARDGLALFAGDAASFGHGAGSIVASLDDSGLYFLPHPRLGSPGALVSLGDEVLAAAKTSFHRLDVSAGGAPIVLQGSVLARPFEAEFTSSRPLVRKGTSAVLPHGGATVRLDSQLWIYDLTLPIVPPFPQRTLTWQVSGFVATSSRLLVALLAQSLRIFDALAQPAATQATFPPLSETQLLWSLEDTGDGSPALAVDEAGHIIVVSAPTVASPQRVELLFFDATTPTAPFLSGRAILQLPDAVSELRRVRVAISGDAVVLTERDTKAVIVLRHLPDGSEIETMRFFTSEAFEPLAFDGRTLVLARRGSTDLAFWDVSGAAPIDLGVVELPDEPVSAVSHADTLLVSGQSSVVTLDPPCPPLP